MEVESPQVGARVHSGTFGQDGVVVRLYGDMVAVRFPSGERTVPARTLEALTADPIQRLANGSFDEDPKWFEIKLRAARLQAAYGSDNLSGLVNSRVILRPHQVFVAHRILEKARPSMILADEVGLGKTIEAGLVLKELLARRSVKRTLIIVPPNLLNQWQTELRIKFNEYFEILDRAGLERVRQLHPNRNPWLSNDRTLVSSYFARDEKNRAELAEGEWDLVIVDEAHHARRKRESSKTTSTQLFRTVELLKDHCFGLMLLTATPMQLHPFEAFSLVELVEPGMYDTYEDFESDVFSSLSMKKAVKTLQEWDESDEPAKTTAAATLRADGVRSNLDTASGREDAVDEILSHVRVTQAIVRNRKRTVGGFTKRKARTLRTSLSPTEVTANALLEDYIRAGYAKAKEARSTALGLELVAYQRIAASSSRALVRALRKRRNRIQGQLDSAAMSDESSDVAPPSSVPFYKDVQRDLSELDHLIELFDSLHDAKAQRLFELVQSILERDPTEKMLIFTQYYATQDLLQEMLSNLTEVTIFRGSQNRDQKDAAVREFREHATVMISTEAGGEGRNFQFCRTVINFDLHWNPMRIEQRIGRVDRYGQRRNVHIYNITAADTIEDRLVEVFTNRLHLFEATVGALELILGEVEEDLRHALLEAQGNVEEAVEMFERNLELHLRDAKKVEEKSADFLIELGSYRADAAKRLTDELEEGRVRIDLEMLVLQLLSYFPTAQVVPDGDSYTITVPPVLPTTINRRLDRTYRGTFSPAVAVEDEGLDFFGFGHPLVDACIEYAKSDVTAGSIGVRALEDSMLAAPAVEFNYLLEFQGIRRWAEVISLVFDKGGARLPAVEMQLALAEPIAPNDDVPSLAVLEALRTAAVQEMQRLLTERAAELQPLNKRRADEEEARAQRIHRYNMRRLDDEETRIRDQIQRLQEEDDPERVRIVPALQGRIESLGRQRAALELDLEEKVAEVNRHSELEPTLELVSVGLLVPTASEALS